MPGRMVIRTAAMHLFPQRMTRRHAIIVSGSITTTRLLLEHALFNLPLLEGGAACVHLGHNTGTQRRTRMIYTCTRRVLVALAVLMFTGGTTMTIRRAPLQLILCITSSASVYSTTNTSPTAAPVLPIPHPSATLA